MSDKKRFPGEHAAFYARSIVEILRPFCERIEIAGSLRRQKLEVGDIEILYVGKKARRQLDLLSDEEFDTAGARIDLMLVERIVEKRPNKNGVFAWGDKNKLGILVESHIPIDFFATSEECWWNSLVCRTGGKDNNLLITTTAQKLGWTFEAYGSGFRDLTHVGRHDTTSERDVYDFLKLPYPEPHQRK